MQIHVSKSNEMLAMNKENDTMNTENPNTEQDENILLAAVLFFLLFLSFFVNLISIIVIATKRRLQTSTNYYEMSTFIFITLALVSVGWLYPARMLGASWLNRVFVVANEAALKSLNIFVVLHETTKIVERYFGLSQPLHSRAKPFKSRAIKRIFCIWCATLAVNIPTFLCGKDAVISTNEISRQYPVGIFHTRTGESGLINAHAKLSGHKQNSTGIDLKQGESSQTTPGPVCRTYISLEAYFDFFFLYFMPLLLNAIFFGITVQQLRHVCEDIKNRPSKQNSISRGRYKPHRCKVISISDIPSSGTSMRRQLSFKNATCTITAMETFQSTSAESEKPQSRASACLKNQFYTLIFPSITFLSKPMDGQSIEPAMSSLSSNIHERAQRQRITKQFSAESATSCMTTISNLSDDNNTTYKQGQINSNSQKRAPFSRMSSVSDPTESSGTQSMRPTKLWKNRIRAVKNLTLTMILFFLKWLPYHITRIYITQNASLCVNGPCGNSPSKVFLETLNQASGFYYFTVTLMSPLLLCVCSSHFCRAFMTVVTCGRSGKKSKHQSEYRTSMRALPTTCD